MTSENKVLRIIYTLFLGLFLAVFVGVGINTFYAGPDEPQWPAYTSSDKDGPTDEEIATQNRYQKEFETYNEAIKPYSRNVSILVLCSAVILIAASMKMKRLTQIIADGVMLGGLFSLLYSLIRGLMADNSRYVFLTVSVSLVVVLILGHHRFSDNNSKLLAKKKGKK